MMEEWTKSCTGLDTGHGLGSDKLIKSRQKIEGKENTKGARCKIVAIRGSDIFCLAQKVPILPRHTFYQEVTL
jgi:hypothetical protein